MNSSQVIQDNIYQKPGFLPGGNTRPVIPPPGYSIPLPAPPINMNVNPPPLPPKVHQTFSEPAKPPLPPKGHPHHHRNLLYTLNPLFLLVVH